MITSPAKLRIGGEPHRGRDDRRQPMPTATRSPTRSPAAPTPRGSPSTPPTGAARLRRRARTSRLPLDAGGDNVYKVTVSVSDGIAAAVTGRSPSPSPTSTRPAPPPTSSRTAPRPAAVETGDPTDYELGMRFQATSAGYDHRAALLPRRGRRRRHRHPDAQPVDGRRRAPRPGHRHLHRRGERLAGRDAGDGGRDRGQHHLHRLLRHDRRTTPTPRAGSPAAHASSDGMLSGLTGNNGVFATGGPGAFPTANLQVDQLLGRRQLPPTRCPCPGLHLARGVQHSREPDAGRPRRHQRRRWRRGRLRDRRRRRRRPLPHRRGTGELRFRTAPDYEARPTPAATTSTT